MNLLPFFQWCEASGVGTAIRDSQWLFPIIEAVHLMAFASIGGAILLVDLRLLGVVLRREPPGELSRDAQPWLLGGLAVMVTTGTLLFLSESVKCYYSNPFRVKMMALFLAIIFTFTVRRKVAAAGEVPFTGAVPLTGKLVALISIVLWGTVAWGGRWIGFSG
jgi:hypothetical protein